MCIEYVTLFTEGDIKILSLVSTMCMFIPGRVSDVVHLSVPNTCIDL